jgi:hypothetical protein
MRQRNCLILGSGRSGTSLACGVLASAGYFMGSDLLPTDDGNPKGYFESAEINEINEQLLAKVVPTRPRGVIGDLFFRSRPPHLQHWLSPVSIETQFHPNRDLLARVNRLTRVEPFCFKDPRFSYTLSVWRPFLQDAVFICIFRDPSTTAESILSQCKRDPFLWNLSITYEQALNVWAHMYQHILEIHYPEGGDWLFAHYDQLLEGAALDRLEAMLHTSVNRRFVDFSLKRSRTLKRAPAKIRNLYEKLCQLAGHTSIMPAERLGISQGLSK